MPKTATPAAKGPSEDTLSAFLVKLATDHSELGHFIRDPDGSMDQAGLSAQDQALLKSGNAAAINARLRGEPAPQAPPPLLLVDVGPDGKPSVRETTAPHIVGAAFQPAYAAPHIVGSAMQPAYVFPHIVTSALHPAAYAMPHIVAATMQPGAYAPPHIVAPGYQPAYAPHIVGPALHPVAYPPHIVGAALPTGAYAPPHNAGATLPPAYLAPHIVIAAIQQPAQSPYWQQSPPTS